MPKRKPKRRTKDFQKSKLSGQVAKGYANFLKKHGKKKYKWTSSNSSSMAFLPNDEIGEPYAE